MVQTIGTWLEASSLGQYVAGSTWAFPMLETCHVLFLATVFGSIALVDLRLTGMAFRHRRIADLSAEILPVTWAAFLGAVISGGLMLSSQATSYLANASFRLKMLTLSLAAVNMLVFHLVTWWTADDRDQHDGPPLAARAAGLLSICCWIGVVVFGRWIGFTLR